MKAISLDCPSCGAPVQTLDLELCTCSHCGRTFAITETGSDGGYPPSSEKRTPTVGSVLWRRLRPHFRIVFSVLATLAILVAAMLIMNFYLFTQRSAFGDESILSSVLLGVAAVLLVVASWRRLAIALLILGGAILISKPLFYPMISHFGPESRPFSLTSETHLNFFIPGALLLLLAFLLALTLSVGTEPKQR